LSWAAMTAEVRGSCHPRARVSWSADSRARAVASAVSTVRASASPGASGGWPSGQGLVAGLAAAGALPWACERATIVARDWGSSGHGAAGAEVVSAHAG
jgi:hypothetical protein